MIVTDNISVAGFEGLIWVVIIFASMIAQIRKAKREREERQQGPEPGRPTPEPAPFSEPFSSAQNELENFLQNLTGGRPARVQETKPPPRPKPPSPPVTTRPAPRATSVAKLTKRKAAAPSRQRRMAITPPTVEKNPHLFGTGKRGTEHGRTEEEENRQAES